MFELRCDRLRQRFFIHQNYHIYGSFKTASIQHDMAKVQQGTVPALQQHKFGNKCTILILRLCLLQGTNKWRHGSAYIYIHWEKYILVSSFFRQNSPIIHGISTPENPYRTFSPGDLVKSAMFSWSRLRIEFRLQKISETTYLFPWCQIDGRHCLNYGDL